MAPPVVEGLPPDAIVVRRSRQQLDSVVDLVDAGNAPHGAGSMRLEATLISVAHQRNLAALVTERDEIEYAVGWQPGELVLDFELLLFLGYRLRPWGSRRKQHKDKD
jgi:hypothetical protein